MGLLITGVLIGWLAEWIFYTFWVKKDTGNSAVVASSGCSAQEAELITKANEIASLKVALENAQSQNTSTVSTKTATKEEKKADVKPIAAVSTTTESSASKSEPSQKASHQKKAAAKSAKTNSSKSTEASTKNQSTVKKNSTAAKAIEKSSSAKPSATKVSTSKVSIKKPVRKDKGDDLTKIEGVGPKAAGALTNAGLATFSDVSKASVEEIQKVLDEAEGRFGMMKPGTWPKQAQLASNEKWDELKKWQDEMNGGIE